MTRSVVVLCGGVGAAKLLRGVIRLVDQTALTAVVNVADDMVMHGLSISPDLDTITYTLADQVSKDRGWGLEGETWQAMEMLGLYGGEDWFGLGDRDLGTHLYRTYRLAAGATLAEVSSEIATTWDLPLALVPVSNDPISTMLTTTKYGEITFQEYFVKHQHSIEVTSVRFAGATDSTPTPGVIESIETADRIVIAPSNPVVSIDPILAVPGIREALVARRDQVTAVSPIVGGSALKGPADRLLRELGHESSVVGIANWYSSIASRLVIDEVDSDQANRVDSFGIRAVVTNTVMSDIDITTNLARVCLS